MEISIKQKNPKKKPKKYTASGLLNRRCLYRLAQLGPEVKTPSLIKDTICGAKNLQATPE
jgi:hypothetical protein